METKESMNKKETVKIYMAPMEGYTNYLFRNVYRKHFQEFDKYFSPFIATNKKASLGSKELRDIRIEDNKDVPLIPQLMTNHPVDCIETCKRIRALGYEEVNINMGCPSGTVVNKGRGAGMLYDTEKLQKFMDEFFALQPEVRVSIKTRLGKSDAAEFYRIFEIFADYPIEELILHPRTREDFYGNVPHLELFAWTMEQCQVPLCYNGDIFTLEDYRRVQAQFPDTTRFMLGRGIIRNPGLLGEICGKEPASMQQVKAFHDELLQAYMEYLSGEKNILYKMKAYWQYMSEEYCDAKTAKRIRKANRLAEYKDIVAGIFA